MELSQIRYFLEVAQTQHVSRSAEHLHIAQPALSRSIHRLEEELGVPLFVPKGRNIVLTEYGKYLQEKLNPIIQELDLLPNQLQTMAHKESHTIRINVLAASILVADATIEYQKSHPNLTFLFTQNTQSELYDVGITTRLADGTIPVISENEFICTEAIYLAVPISSSFAARPTIQLQEVADEGFISLMGSRQLRSICDRFCHRAGFRPRVVFESDGTTAVKNMIASGGGIGFWPEFTWRQLETDQVVLKKIINPRCQRHIVINRRHNKAQNQSVDDYFEFLKQYCLTAKQKSQQSHG